MTRARECEAPTRTEVTPSLFKPGWLTRSLIPDWLFELRLTAWQSATPFSFVSDLCFAA